MSPLFVLAQHYADATRPRKAENAQPGAPVERPSRYVESRRDWILGQMRELGGKEYLKAIEGESRGSTPARTSAGAH